MDYFLIYEICVLFLSYKVCFLWLKVPSTESSEEIKFQTIFSIVIFLNLIIRNFLCLIILYVKKYMCPEKRNEILLLSQLYEIIWTICGILIFFHPFCFTIDTEIHLPFLLLTGSYSIHLILRFLFPSAMK